MEEDLDASLVSVVEDHSPPSSPSFMLEEALADEPLQLPEVDEDEEDEHIAAIRPYMFEPLAPVAAADTGEEPPHPRENVDVSQW